MNRRFILASILVLLLYGCAKDGLGAHVDPETAQNLALKSTPLVEVTRLEGSPDLPFRHAIWGKDASGRELVVWVKSEVTRFAYLDELITRDQAVSLALEAGLKPGDTNRVMLGHLEGQGRPVYWHVSNGPNFVRVDAKTGKILSTNIHANN
jgi:uncharacterized protein YpmB